MKKPTKLEKAAWTARAAHRAFLEEIRDARDERIAKCTKEIDADLRRLDAQVKELADAAWAAEQAELAEREQLAAASLPYSVGTKLCGWYREPRRYGMGKMNEWQITAHGIVEICTRETVHPAGMASYSRADVGKVLVRLMKKDGTPGLKYEVLDGNSYRGHTWLPEGRKPKGAE